MTERQFIVEWSDPYCPAIVDAGFLPHINTRVTGPMSLEDAKRAVIGHLEAQIAVARKMITWIQGYTESTIPERSTRQ